MNRKSGDRMRASGSFQFSRARGAPPEVEKMKRFFVTTVSLGLSISSFFFGSMVGCDDGDDTVVKAPDGGSPTDGALPDSTTVKDGTTGETSTTDGGDSAAPTGTPPWMLITVNGKTSSELIVFGLGNRIVGGRMPFDGFIGLTYIDSLGRPFLLEQAKDIVAELDPLEPWKTRASWDVHLNDGADGGTPYADPVAVVPVATGKSYVVRFNRNNIAVIDDTLKQDAAPPTKSIDLKQFFDPADTDTSVDPIAAVVANGKVYVLLANLDLNNVDTQGFYTICTSSKPKLIVIDPTTDALASKFVASDGGTDAGDAGDGGAPAVVSLLGYNPTLNGLLFDAPRHRLLVFQGGCNSKLGDGGKGPLERRQIDAVDLNTGAVTKVLDLASEGYPSAVVRSSDDEVLLGLDFFATKVWNVTSSSLGASLPDGISALASDKQGHALGVVDTSLTDGGTAKEMIQVTLDGGAVTSLGQLPVDGGFVGAADYLPGQ
jgi:hypothetical protein